MEIHTFDTVYFVIHSGKTKGQMPVYLCRKESDGQLYQLFAMKKQFIRKETISFLNEQLQNKEFDDFSDLFLYQEQLFAAIRYYADSSLEEKKEENLEFEERLEIGRQILERFLITKMPAFFCCQCLDPERILLTDSLEVHFSYTLDKVGIAAAVTMQDFWNAFADFLEEEWSKELTNQIVDGLSQYISFLRLAEHKTEELVYRKYLLMREKLIQIPREERNRSRSHLFLLWDKNKKRISAVKKILAFLILLAALVYFIYTVWEQKQPDGGSEKLIHYIGTLSVPE